MFKIIFVTTCLLALLGYVQSRTAPDNAGIRATLEVSRYTFAKVQKIEKILVAKDWCDHFPEEPKKGYLLNEAGQNVVTYTTCIGLTHQTKEPYNGNARVCNANLCLEGTFEGGYLTGAGTVIYNEDHYVMKADFNKGLPIDNIVISDDTGRTIYDGSLENPEKSIPQTWQSAIRGKGTIYYSNGESYTGDVRGAKREGNGILKKKDGEDWTGSWKNDYCVNGNCMECTPGIFYDSCPSL